jgi:hypothetical protein
MPLVCFADATMCNICPAHKNFFLQTNAKCQCVETTKGADSNLLLLFDGSLILSQDVDLSLLSYHVCMMYMEVV